MGERRSCCELAGRSSHAAAGTGADEPVRQAIAIRLQPAARRLFPCARPELPLWGAPAGPREDSAESPPGQRRSLPVTRQGYAEAFPLDAADGVQIQPNRG